MRTKNTSSNVLCILRHNTGGTGWKGESKCGPHLLELTTNTKLPTTKPYQLPKPHYQLPTTKPQQIPIPNYQLPKPNYQLPTPNYQLLKHTNYQLSNHTNYQYQTTKPHQLPAPNCQLPNHINYQTNYQLPNHAKTNTKLPTTKPYQLQTPKCQLPNHTNHQHQTTNYQTIPTTNTELPTTNTELPNHTNYQLPNHTHVFCSHETNLKQKTPISLQNEILWFKCRTPIGRKYLQKENTLERTHSYVNMKCAGAQPRYGTDSIWTPPPQ